MHFIKVRIEGEVVPALLAVRLVALEIVNRGAHGLSRLLARTHRLDPMSDHLQGLERHHDFVIFDVVANKNKNPFLRHKDLWEHCDRNESGCAAWSHVCFPNNERPSSRGSQNNHSPSTFLRTFVPLV